jgi:hypothetical protein
MAGFGKKGAIKSGVTSLAGFAGIRFPQKRGSRTTMPAAFRQALAVSRRAPVACSMRRKGHPSFPSAMTCCFFFFAQDIAHAEEAYKHSLRSQCPGLYRWPVFN